MEGITNAAAGMVTMGFFACYGIGQLFSGFIGDKVSPKGMMFVGLVASAFCNLAMIFQHNPQMMLILWCINGFAQSMHWTPVLRLIAIAVPAESQKKFCINITTAYPAGTLAAYAFAAWILKLAGWQVVFAGAFILLLAACIAWSFLPGSQKGAEVVKEDLPRNQKMPVALLTVLGCVLVAQGFLRDGITSWMPVYLANVFEVTVSTAIISTTLLPLCNMLGLWVTGKICKYERNEIKGAVYLFAAAVVLAMLLLPVGSTNYSMALICLGMLTACMVGVNLILVSLVPLHFAHLGRVTMVGGLLNALVYLGSSISAYGIGKMSDLYGWGILLKSIAGISVLGGALCLLCLLPWKKFIAKEMRL